MLLPLEANGNGHEAVTADRIAAPGDQTVLSVDDTDLAPLIVSRVISSLASRADLSLDRLSDALLLGDAIASQAASGSLDGRVQIALEDSDGEITVRVGPLREGAAERMLERLEVPTLGTSLTKLANEVRIDTGAAGEHLVIRVAQRLRQRGEAS
jgi:hypothetical protein